MPLHRSPYFRPGSKVRFAWTEVAMPNLVNAAGLPALPFRTDDWPALKARVAAELKTTFKSHYAGQVTLAEALSLSAIGAYGKRATGEKFLIRPNPAD